MSKAIPINQIEQQIEALPPVEQIMMLERIVSHLKRLLLANSTTSIPRADIKGIAEKLNQIYETETSQLDPRLFNAQFASIARDEWR